MSTIKAALFDMDGTLISSEGITEQCIEDLIKEFDGASPFLERSLGNFHGMTWAHIEEKLRQNIPELDKAYPTPKSISIKLQKIFLQKQLDDVPGFVPGAPAFLTELKAHYSIAITTSGNKSSVEALLYELKREDPNLCEIPYICAEDVRHSKPHPEPYLKSAALLGYHPQECMVFEDSLAGIESARQAGMTVVAVTEFSSDPRLAAQMAHTWILNFKDEKLRALKQEYFKAL